MKRGAFARLAACATLALSSAALHAQPAPPASTPAASASAQPAALDPTAARTLFDEATKALDKGDWDGACPKFDASFSFKPTVSALLNIAKCHDHAGKLTLAADDYHRARKLNEETASPARKKDLDDFANDALRKLEPRIPRLRVIVAAPPPDLAVTCDGRPLPAAALGLALPVDPGEHVVRATAPGRRAEPVRLTLLEGKQADATIELVADSAAAPTASASASPTIAPAPATASASVSATASPSAAPEGSAGARSGVPAWAWVAGIAGLALGGVAIGIAIDGAGANCGGPCTDDRFTQKQVDALNGRRHLDLGLGLALGIAGALGLAAGLLGIVTAPGAQPSRSGLAVHPWAARDAGGIGLRGAF